MMVDGGGGRDNDGSEDDGSGGVRHKAYGRGGAGEGRWSRKQRL